LKNVVGFLPFGFCFYAYLVTRPSLKRATALTVALGTAASLTIEVLQAFLPTRASGTSDLFTNALGTFIGALAFRVMVPTLARFFPAISIAEE
jgi:glycopeptide antibiotics resistance protein